MSSQESAIGNRQSASRSRLLLLVGTEVASSQESATAASRSRLLLLLVSLHRTLYIMECKEEEKGSESNKIKKIFAEFMTGITKFDELVAEGGRLLAAFQQGLEFLRRPPINQTSVLVEKIIKVNETARLKSYIEAGCINVSDGLQNMTKSRSILNELETLVEDVSVAMQMENRMLPPLEDEDYGLKFDQISLENEAAEFQEEKAVSQVTDYVALIGIIYSMVKQDFAMQERIVPALNLKTPSEELETYCMMWYLRPFVNDEIMQHAWKLIP